jgi:hypothetical protein
MNEELEPCPSSHYTPYETIDLLLKDITFNEGESTLEPTAGREMRIYNKIPFEKDWCEIDLGRDFFTYDFGDKKFDKIITNPPYRSNHKQGHRINIAIKTIEKSFELCKDECWFLLNNQMFNSLTKKRLEKYKELGFCIVFMRVLEIKCWYGRYYWVCFKKGGKSILTF